MGHATEKLNKLLNGVTAARAAVFDARLGAVPSKTHFEALRGFHHSICLVS